MSDLIVERSYSHPFLNDPRLFYYHQSCWTKVAPPDLAHLSEGVVYEAPRGDVCLIPLRDVLPGTQCQQCDQGILAVQP